MSTKDTVEKTLAEFEGRGKALLKNILDAMEASEKDDDMGVVVYEDEDYKIISKSEIVGTLFAPAEIMGIAMAELPEVLNQIPKESAEELVISFMQDLTSILRNLQ